MSMMKKNETTDNGISIQIPVKITLTALEKVLQEKLVGYQIQKEEAKGQQYGKILAVHLSNGKPGFDVCIRQQVLMKTMLFKNKTISFSFQLKFDFDEEQQEIIIKNYQVEGEQKAWLTNRLLKTMMTLLMKKKLSGNSKLFLTPKISEFLQQINQKLENIIEVKKGVQLFGAINDFKIQNLYFKEDAVVVLVKLEGNLAAEVSEIELPN